MKPHNLTPPDLLQEMLSDYIEFAKEKGIMLR